MTPLPVAFAAAAPPGAVFAAPAPRPVREGVPAGATAGPAVPGLAEGFVPQGLAAAGGRAFVTHYDGGPGGRAARVSVTDLAAGTFLGSAALRGPGGVPHRGHVGGAAALAGHLFVASDGSILRFPLDPLTGGSAPPHLTADRAVRCETNADCCGTDPARNLWVGEFARYPSAVEYAGGARVYPTAPAHHRTDRVGSKKYTWAVRYPGGDLAAGPDAVLSIRRNVQGPTFLPGTAVLSVSYGRNTVSKLAFYDDPTAGPAADPDPPTVKLRGRAVPLFYLDGVNHRQTLTVPPMGEGVAPDPADPRRALWLTESGAAKYRTELRTPVDVLLHIPVPR